LFLPRLGYEGLEAVTTTLIDQFSAHHIRAIGAFPHLKGRRDRKGRPYYLIEALEKALGSLLASKEQRGLQEYLHQLIAESGTDLLSFPGLRSLKDYLRNLSPNVAIIPDEWYVPNMRPDTLNRADQILKDEHVLEIVGPPGIGKSVLAMELIQSSKLEFQELSPARECRTLHDVCSWINGALRDEFPAELGEEGFIQLLAHQPFVFWVKGYDRASAEGLNKFFRKLRSYKGLPNQLRACWIVESTYPLSVLKELRQELDPLDNQQISNILQKVRAGGAFIDPEEVIRRAQGNPGVAMRLWQSQTLSEAKIANEFEWFRHQLTLEEALVLPLLCVAARSSPLGVTLNTLVKWGSAVYPARIPSRIQEGVESLLDKLERRRLAGVTRLNREMFGGLLDVIPKELSITIIDNVTIELIEDTLSSVSEVQQKDWQERLHEVLLTSAETDTLAYVTLAAGLNDLAPFVQSSYRLTHLRRLLAWLDRTGWEPVNPRQIYLKLHHKGVMTKVATPG
jgi:hypothetical protein